MGPGVAGGGLARDDERSHVRRWRSGLLDTRSVWPRGVPSAHLFGLGRCLGGTVANVLLLLIVAFGWLTEGPRSFHAQYLRDAHAGLARAVPTPLVTEADLARLPDPVKRYLRVTRSVGQPRVQNYHLRFRGRIRSAPDSHWMPFEAEQQSFADQPTRLFLMRARMFGVPVQAFHRAVGGHATMQVTVAGAFPLENARGAEMDRAETVTLFNDMCLLAPGTSSILTLRGSPLTRRPPLPASRTKARRLPRRCCLPAPVNW